VLFQTENSLYPVNLSWPNLNNYYSGTVRLQDLFGGIIVNVDMKAETVCTITSGATDHLLIIAEGPKNLIGLTIDSIWSEGASVSGRFNPNGYVTNAWFDWGLTSTYGNSTASRSIGSGTNTVVFTESLQNLDPGTLYHYRVVTENVNGAFYGVDQWLETPNAPLSVRHLMFIENYGLYQNYPNPFNPSTTIRYTIPRQSLVTLKVYDVLGREIATLVEEAKPMGVYTVPWDARNVSGGYASGVYFYRIVAGSWTETKKLMVLK